MSAAPRTSPLHNLIQYPPATVLPNRLFLGDEMNACSRRTLRLCNVRHVVAVGERSFPSDGIHVAHIPISDRGRTTLERILPEIFLFIEESEGDGAVLIHCAAGINRAPAVTMAYLVLRCNWRLSDAAMHLKTLRPQVSPCTSYMEQLLYLEREHLGFNSWNFDSFKLAMQNGPTSVGPSLSQFPSPVLTATHPPEKITQSTFSKAPQTEQSSRQRLSAEERIQLSSSVYTTVPTDVADIEEEDLESDFTVFATGCIHSSRSAPDGMAPNTKTRLLPALPACCVGASLSTLC